MSDKVNKELEILKNRIHNEIAGLKKKGFDKRTAEGIASLNFSGNKYLKDLATAIFNEVYSN